MSLRTDLLPVFQEVRELIADEDTLDLRTHRVIRRLITWQGDAVGIGEACVDDLELLPKPRVREDGQNLIVDKITPSHSGGGYTPEELNPPKAYEQDTNVELVYFVEGPKTGTYVLIDSEETANFGYKLTLSPVRRVRPV